MDIRPARRRMLITYASYFLVFAAASARALYALRNTADAGFLIIMLSIYLLLLVVEPWLISRNLITLHIINALQAGIGLILLGLISYLDYFALLLIPPCVQSIYHFPRKTAFVWIGGICTLMVAVLFRHFPLSESIGYVIIYPTAIFLFTGFGYLALQAEIARNRSEMLLDDLQKANQKLQAYAAQVQELAATNERNRLARELHDSVTQIIFGLTLSAQATRILMDRDPSRVPAELDHMQVLAQSALAEMRALIQQLHPRQIADDGLVSGLRRLASEHQASDGLTVDVHISGERRLPGNIEEELLRIAQEALNNIVKHAHTDHAVIELNLKDESRVSMQILDAGAGFNTSEVQSLPGHLGLTSMHERIQALGGTLAIHSTPGKGTCLQVELALKQEAEYAW